MQYLEDTLIPYSDIKGKKNESILEKKTKINKYPLIKKVIWLYFFLLIFEGALRKWVFPSLASPLLIIRDPVAIWALILAQKEGVFPSNSTVKGMIAIGIIGIITAIFFGHGNLAVALFGARILLIHFPLIYVIGRVYDFEDVIKMGKVTLFISIPMVVLLVFQFYSPQSAWVNRGIGGDEAGGGFSGAMGFFRPPATFSFITGTVSFFSLCSSFIVYFLINQKGVNKLVLYGATAALILAVPLSISRSLFFGVAITLVFTAIAVARNSKYLGRMLVGAVAVFGAVYILKDTPMFSISTVAFTSRFETANEQEGGLNGVLIDRFLGGMWGALTTSSNQPFFGLGLGLGSNVGSQITTGQTGFIAGEGEWARMIGELGPLMGVLMIFYRLQFCVQLAIASYKKLVRSNLLPWMFLSFILVNVPQGQWAQPTSLGFGVLVAGLAMAALKGPVEEKKIRTIKVLANGQSEETL